MNSGTWVLVSDACRARLFADRGQHNGLEELEGFTCTAAREHIKDRVSDRSGLKPAGGHGVRVGATQEVDPKESEARAFARFLVDTLKRKHNEQAFRELVLAASPHFLGLLRSAMDETLAKCVVASLDKDLTTLDIQTLSVKIHAGASR
jgi:protein required for attachment to host cells